MWRAIAIARAGEWPAWRADATVTLTIDDRVRRRLRLKTDGGESFLLDLPEVARLEDGDGLRLEGGGWIAVQAARESVVEVVCDSATALARIAWHLGNRHVPAQILDGAIRFRDDPVIVHMIEGLGATTKHLVAPFQPEPGAYHRHGDAGAHDHG